MSICQIIEFRPPDYKSQLPPKTPKTKTKQNKHKQANKRRALESTSHTQKKIYGIANYTILRLLEGINVRYRGLIHKAINKGETPLPVTSPK